jgi:hypothetical protein
MTKTTAMTDQEKLKIVESKLRKRRLSAKETSSLLRQHERLSTKIAGRGPGRPPLESQPDPRFAEFTVPQQRVLERLTGDELEIWEHVYRIENERRAQRQPQPEQDRPKPGMTNEEIKSFYASRGQAAPAHTSQEIKADVD